MSSQPPMAQADQATRTPIRIVLVDDHAVLRAGTRRILEDEPDLRVIGEASDGEGAITLATQSQPDVVVIDISMPHMDGIAASTELRRSCPLARLLILTAYDRRAYVRAFFRLGAAGYLLKSSSATDLIAAIRRIHMGEHVYDPAVLDLLAPVNKSPTEPTARELDVIREIALGRSNREIAEALGLTENTVEYHLRNAYGKLGVTSRSDALRRARDMQWLDSLGPLC